MWFIRYSGLQTIATRVSVKFFTPLYDAPFTLLGQRFYSIVDLFQSLYLAIIVCRLLHCLLWPSGAKYRPIVCMVVKWH